MMIGNSNDTALVTATVLDVQAIQKGQLIALASVEIEVEGVMFAVNGLQVIRTREPKTNREATAVALPRYRAPGGQWRIAIDLPDELRAPVAAAVLERCCEMGITKRLHGVAA